MSSGRYQTLELESRNNLINQKMDRLLRPDRFDADPNASDGADSWDHWYLTFTNFLDLIESHNPDKLKTLFHFLSPSVYKFVSRCTDYDSAISTLNSLYIQPKNEIYSRHVLATAKQQSNESLDQFMQKLRSLAKDCNFEDVSAEKNQEDAIRDAFISGISSNSIRQRLLEHKTLNVKTAFDQAKALDFAQQQSQSFVQTTPAMYNAAASNTPNETLRKSSDEHEAKVAASQSKCFFCGYDRHPRYKCPARDALCQKCGKKGHYQKVCRSTSRSVHTASASPFVISSIVNAAAPTCLARAITEVIVNGVTLNALIDTGSSDSYVSENVARKNQWLTFPSKTQIILASTRLVSNTKGHCFVSLIHKKTIYPGVKLSVLPDLCTDILLGHDFLERHKSVEIPFQGVQPSFSLCNLSASTLPSPALFANLDPTCRPICIKSRRHSFEDEHFIRAEIDRLLKDNVIEPSRSPWRAQVLVVTNERQKRRMVIDYSQTINRFTHLDAYPLPRIDDMVSKISQYGIFSTVDLQSAYHQIPIKDGERHYTAFEACNGLYQFRRIPFGVTNGVACFQRVMDEFVKQESLKGTFVYVDNITICGENELEHDKNLNRFMEAAAKYGLTLNRDKCTFASKMIRLLGYEITKGTIKPDPERFKALLNLPPPCDSKTQQRIVGMFSYYSQWFSQFSDKIHPLVINKSFPLPKDVLNAYESLKNELVQASLFVIDRDVPLVVETDASDIGISATLNQSGRPVAFFSRTLSPAERNHSAVEKEAYAIIEAIRKWRHYLIGTHFKLITDQRSVAFMYDSKTHSKVKNDKIQRWRIELSQYSYDVVYRPGLENPVADTLSRAVCGNVHSDELKRLHESLCHPGITRLFHFVKMKNLPYSLDNVKSIIQQCSICAQLKPKFFVPSTSALIKATQPFERLSMDFKGPIPSSTRNRYLLTVIDEYSRFPFAFPCPDMTSSTVISRLTELFSIFGMPSFIHSDRGSSFMSEELKTFLHDRGVATSRTTSYNPQGNGQVERLNSTLWKTVSLCLRTRNMRVEQWEYVLQESLHAIRSLLCTSINATPHERMFLHNRKSPTGTSLPQWLLAPGPVLYRKNVRTSKYEPLVEEVELLESNPEYAHIKFPDGREETVSLRQLAPTALQTPQITTCEPITHQSLTNNTNDTPNTHCDSPNNTDVSASAENFENLLLKQQRVRPYSLRSREV